MDASHGMESVIGDARMCACRGACGWEEGLPVTMGGKRDPRQNLRLWFSIILDVISHKKSSL